MWFHRPWLWMFQQMESSHSRKNLSYELSALLTVDQNQSRIKLRFLTRPRLPFFAVYLQRNLSLFKVLLYKNQRGAFSATNLTVCQIRTNLKAFCRGKNATNSPYLDVRAILERKEKTLDCSKIRFDFYAHRKIILPNAILLL